MASTGEVWKLGHRPALDSLRGIAVLLVVAGHTWPELHTALTGVAVFFTLSGFLITTLLLEERTSTGRVSLLGFYRRRALRLLPASLVFLVLMAALGQLTWHQAWPVLAYVENYAVILTGHTGIVLHFWSLSVEEQFYIVWPALLLLTLRRPRAIGWLIGGLFLTSTAVNWLVWDAGAGAYHVSYGFDTNAAALLVGCGLAVFMHGRPDGRCRPWVAAAAMAAVTSVVLVDAWWLGLTMRTLVPLLTALAIYCVARGAAPAAWTNRALVLVGKRSYALYIWHTPLAFGLLLGPLRAVTPEPVAVVAFLAIAWGIVTGSWYLVERPFLRLKEQTRRAPRPRHAPFSPSGGSGGDAGDAAQELVADDVLGGAPVTR